MVEQIFHDFCQETTAHGFLRIGDPSRKRWARILWTLVMLAFAAVFVWQIAELVQKYYNFETNVNTKVDVNTEMVFPTVTLCNLNPFQKSKLPEDSDIAEYNRIFEQASGIQMMDEMKVQICQNGSLKASVADLFCAMPNDAMDIASKGDEARPEVPSASDMATPAEASTESGTPPAPSDRVERAAPIVDGIKQILTNDSSPDTLLDDGFDSDNTTKGLLSDPQPPIQPIQPTSPPPGGRKVSWLMMENKAAKDIGTLAAKDVTMYKNAAQPQTEFIEECQFNMGECEGIAVDWHPWYGACYTFNSRGNYSSIRPGPMYGLVLELNVESQQYLRSTYMLGVMVAVAQAYRRSFPETNGVLAPVGASTAIGVSTSETTRLGTPYDDCLADSSSMNNSEEYMYNSNYTVMGCMHSCFQRRIVAECGCWSFAYPPPPGRKDTVPQCSNATQSMCAMDRDKLKPDNCTCWPLCEQLEYKLTVSQSVWPAQKPKPDCATPGSPQCQDPIIYAKENQLKLQIYFESLTKLIYSESKAYTFLSLVSDFGGQLGLWIGASFCTMVEMFSFAASVIVGYCGGGGRSKKNVEKRPDGAEDDRPQQPPKVAAPRISIYGNPSPTVAPFQMPPSYVGS